MNSVRRFTQYYQQWRNILIDVYPKKVIFNLPHVVHDYGELVNLKVVQNKDGYITVTGELVKKNNVNNTPIVLHERMH